MFLQREYNNSFYSVFVRGNFYSGQIILLVPCTDMHL